MAIQRYIYGMSKKGVSGEEIRISLIEKFSLTAEEADLEFTKAFAAVGMDIIFRIRILSISFRIQVSMFLQRAGNRCRSSVTGL